MKRIDIIASSVADAKSKLLTAMLDVPANEPVTIGDPIDDKVVRAIAELIATGLVTDRYVDGMLRLTLTKKGIRAAQALKQP
jgi:hypothetical protein